MLDWPLQRRAETLGTGFDPSPAEDEMGLFHGRTAGVGTLETQGFNSIDTSSSMGASENCYSSDTPRSPLPLTTGGDTD